IAAADSYCSRNRFRRRAGAGKMRRGKSLNKSSPMDPFGLKTIFITALVFVPLERLFTLHREQKVFRPGWANDLIFLIFNGSLTKLGMFAVFAGSIFVAANILPASFQDAVGSLPLWVQLPTVILLSDLG